MTKWARLRKRKERKRAEALRRSEAEGKEVKPAEPEKIPENIQHSQEIEKLEDTKTSSPNTILSQIPRYAYLLAFFVLLAGIFYPLSYTFINFDPVVQGAAALFVGLAGAILLFKGAESGKVRGIFIVVGFALFAISLAMIFMLQDHVIDMGF